MSLFLAVKGDSEKKRKFFSYRERSTNVSSRKLEKEQPRKIITKNEAEKIKSDNFIRTNREKLSIAITILRRKKTVH